MNKTNTENPVKEVIFLIRVLFFSPDFAVGFPLPHAFSRKKTLGVFLLLRGLADRDHIPTATGKRLAEACIIGLAGKIGAGRRPFSFFFSLIGRVGAFLLFSCGKALFLLGFLLCLS